MDQIRGMRERKVQNDSEVTAKTLNYKIAIN